MNLPERKRLISSNMTVVLKLVFPAIWIGGFACANIALWFGSSDTPAPPDMKWIFLGVWLAGSSFILWLTIPLKRVELNGTRLVISNFFSDITIDVDQIERVSETFFVNPPRVTLHLKKDTAFGRKIAFLPKARLSFVPWRSQPIVGELRQLAGVVPPEPPAPEMPGWLKVLPIARSVRKLLARLHATEATRYLKVNLVLGTLIAMIYAQTLFMTEQRLATQSGAVSWAVLVIGRNVVFPGALLVVLASLAGLAFPNMRAAALRLQAWLLTLATLGLVYWILRSVLHSIPRGTSIGWTPGLLEAAGGYAGLLLCRFALPQSTRDRPGWFYLPALVALLLVPLDLAILFRFIESVSRLFR